MASYRFGIQALLPAENGRGRSFRSAPCACVFLRYDWVTRLTSTSTIFSRDRTGMYSWTP